MKNLPNIITSFRFLLIPSFVYVYFSSSPNNLRNAFIIFIVAGISDVLDGMIARKYNLVTKLGTVLDPLADKLMLMTVLLCLTYTGSITHWVPIIVGIKEFIMIAGAIYLYFSGEKAVIPSDKFGKIATVLFYAAISVIVFDINLALSKGVMLAAVVVTMLAFINYLRIYMDMKKTSN
ncbi:MAG: CDP-diacylglycerol--glycerol-3-phosphate 3-phosphatidyltransferase [Acidaminobacteraceae bacterium]